MHNYWEHKYLRKRDKNINLIDQNREHRNAVHVTRLCENFTQEDPFPYDMTFIFFT